MEKHIERAYGFLETQIKRGGFDCFIGEDRTLKNGKLSPPEVGSSLFALETAYKCRNDSETTKSILPYIQKFLTTDSKIYFFMEHNRLSLDAETTAYGLAALWELHAIERQCIEPILSEIASNIDSEKRVRVYFEPCTKENRIDLVSAVNILHLFHLMGRQTEVSQTEKWIREALEKNFWESRYYHSPDTFPYFLSRMVALFPKRFLGWKELILQSLAKRYGISRYPLDLAMRITAAKRLGVNPTREETELLRQQQGDGGWPADAIYHWGRSIGYFGSRAISTMLAIEALSVS